MSMINREVLDFKATAFHEKDFKTVTKEDILAAFLRQYLSLKSGKLNVSELAGVCDLSRTTV